jgi:putative redox protein
MKIYLQSTDQPARFEASNERGHTVVVEGSSKFGGKDTAPSPVELLVMSQAGCTAIDVVTILQKMKQPIENLEIISEVFRTPGQIPNIINSLHLHFKIHGAVDSSKAEKAISMSIEKYCPVSKMIDQVVKITHTFEIISDDTPLNS